MKTRKEIAKFFGIEINENNNNVSDFEEELKLVATYSFNEENSYGHVIEKDKISYYVELDSESGTFLLEEKTLESVIVDYFNFGMSDEEALARYKLSAIDYLDQDVDDNDQCKIWIDVNYLYGAITNVVSHYLCDENMETIIFANKELAKKHIFRKEDGVYILSNGEVCKPNYYICAV